MSRAVAVSYTHLDVYKRQYQKMISRQVSKSGSTGGRSVCNLEGSYLKGINV